MLSIIVSFIFVLLIIIFIILSAAILFTVFIGGGMYDWQPYVIWIVLLAIIIVMIKHGLT